MKFEMPRNSSLSRRSFIGGSDARIILGHDEVALIRLWREKRGEIEPGDLSGNLIVQLGIVTEPLNRPWFERKTGRAITDVQKRIQHPVVRWIGGDPRWGGRGNGCSIRSEIYAAVVVLRRGRSAKVSTAASAQYVGDKFHDLGALGHHWGWQMGRDRSPGRFPLSASAVHCREEVLALRGERRASSSIRDRDTTRSYRGRARRRYEFIE